MTSILEAADRILRAEGYEAASTNRVARVAGFSVGSLYQYFRDKQSVVGALIDRSLAEEAEALAELLEQGTHRSPADLARSAFDLLAGRRVASAHLLRALDGYGAELGMESALDHIVAAQAPPLSDTVQRVGAFVLPRSARSVDARMFVLARLVGVACFSAVVDAPYSPGWEALRDEFVAALGTFLADGAPPRAAVELARSWSKSAGAAASPAEQRARRRREARAILLAADVAADRLEPCTFLLAGLAEVAAATQRPPYGVSQEDLLHEVARFAAALGA